MSHSIGLIELSSIAAGFEVCDAMLKESDVELVLARTICSGKYMVMVKGDVAAVESAVQAGRTQNEFSVIDTFVIPNVDESLFPAIAGRMDRDCQQRYARITPSPAVTAKRKTKK